MNITYGLSTVNGGYTSFYEINSDTAQIKCMYSNVAKGQNLANVKPMNYSCGEVERVILHNGRNGRSKVNLSWGDFLKLYIENKKVKYRTEDKLRFKNGKTRVAFIVKGHCGMKEVIRPEF